MSEEQGLSEFDSKLYQFLEENKGVDVQIVIDFQEDLGVRVMAISAGDSVARSGDPISATNAVLRLLPKTTAKIEEYRASMAALGLDPEDGDHE